MMSTTCALCHGVARATSVTLIALLEPGIAAVVVAVALPETRLVVVEHAQTGDELSALPEVEMRHEQARRAAVLAFERFAVEVPHHPGLSARHIGERQVRRVTRVRERQ